MSIPERADPKAQVETGKGADTVKEAEVKTEAQKPNDTQKESPKVPQEELKDIEKERNRLHYQKLDFIQSVMERGGEYAKSFFSKEENRDLADTANSSTRLKAKYREIMESKEPERKPERESKVSEDEITDRVEASILRKSEERERKLALREFVAMNGLNADESEPLRKAADALSLSLGIDFQDALQKAHNAISGERAPRSVNIRSTAPSTLQVKDKAKEVSRMVSELGISKESAEKYLDTAIFSKDSNGNITGMTIKIA